jgi:O-antigen/teichoic acid export membrane protein
MEDKLKGRILGGVLPIVPIAAWLAWFFYKRGKRIQLKYWKYALPICLPYIPHVLSLTLLSSMDRTMITRLCGPEDNAIYSLAYTCSSMITMLVGSLNSAFAPWIGEKLHEKKYADINRVSRVYMTAFVAMAALIVLAAPEVIAIVGGSKYREGIWVLPPVAAGVMLQFLYCMFVNVEQFEKKTTGMAFASVSAALLNWGLNAYFIPRYGYIAAAYTTFAGYLWMLLVHMFLVYHYGYREVYDYRLVMAMVGVITVVMLAATWLYGQTVIRYIVLGVYALALGAVFLKKKDLILGLFRKKKE